MSFINKKIFGSDIDSKVKQKLELLQLLSGNELPDDLLYNLQNVNTAKEFKSSKYVKYAEETAYKLEDLINSADLQLGAQFLSQRVPFARMWTSLGLSKYIESDVNNVGVFDTYEDVQNALISAGIKNLKENEFIGKFQGQGPNYGKYTVLKAHPLTANKVYTVGTHNLNQISGYSSDPIEASEYMDTDGSITDFTKYGESVFGDELGVNPFMKPPAGIIQISSETEGSLGAIKKTNIVFVVSNFRDFDEIYSKYFLRPGAQIFLDFGWNNSTLYTPEDVIDPAKRAKLPAPYNKLDVGEILYGEEGFVAKSNGDLEIVNGFVTNYDAKIRENGTVECSLEITSRNEALFKNKFSEDEAIRERLAYSIDKEIMRFVMTFYAKQEALGELSDAERNVLVNGDWTTDGDVQAQLEDAWEYFVTGKGDGKKSICDSADLRNTPNDTALEVGVYWAGDEPDDKNLYMTIGFLEDKVLNKEFGFGDELDNDPLQEAERLQPRFDSRNSLIIKHSHLMERQKRIMKDKITKVPVIFPPTLYSAGTFDASKGDEPLKKTYDSIRKKLPKVPFATRAKGSSEEIIPLRDLFVQVDLVKEAIKDSSDVEEMMEYIIKKLKKATGKIYDFKVGTKYDGTVSSFIDNNYFYANDNAADNGELFYDSLFIFNPHSKDSIVKNMDLTFEMPKDGLSSMVAITNSGPAGGIINTSQLTDIALKQKTIDQLEGIGAEYLPKLGDHAVVNQENDIDGLMTNYAEGDSVFGDTYTANDPAGDYQAWSTRANEMSWGHVSVVTGEEYNNNSDKMFAKHWGDYSPDDDVAREKNVAKNIMCKDALKWFEVMVGITSAQRKPTSTIMPLKLRLTIHGISSLQPGDLFRVDYLPKRYQKKVFFQVTGISHEITPSSWSTSLETVMRIRPETAKVPQDVTPDYVVIDKRTLEKTEKLDKQKGTDKNQVDPIMIKMLMPRIKQLRPLISTTGTFSKDCSIYEFKGHRHGSDLVDVAPGGPDSPSGIAMNKKKSYHSGVLDQSIHNQSRRKFRIRNWATSRITTEKKLTQMPSEQRELPFYWSVSLPYLSTKSKEFLKECDLYCKPRFSNLDTQPRFLNVSYWIISDNLRGGLQDSGTLPYGDYGKGKYNLGTSDKVGQCWFSNFNFIHPMRWRTGSAGGHSILQIENAFMGGDGSSNWWSNTNTMYGQPLWSMAHYISSPNESKVTKSEYFGPSHEAIYHRTRGAMYEDMSTFFTYGAGSTTNTNLLAQTVFEGEVQYGYHTAVFQDWTYRLYIYKNLFMVVPTIKADGTSTFLGGGDEAFCYALKMCYDIGFTPTRIPMQNYVQHTKQTVAQSAGIGDDLETRIQKQKDKFGTAASGF